MTVVVSGFFYLDMPQSAPAPQTVNVLPRLSGDNFVCGAVVLLPSPTVVLSLCRCVGVRRSSSSLLVLNRFIGAL